MSELKYGTLKDLLKAICDAVRNKDGTTEDIAHQDIPERIKDIPTGGLDTDVIISLIYGKDGEQ